MPRDEEQPGLIPASPRHDPRDYSGLQVSTEHSGLQVSPEHTGMQVVPNEYNKLQRPQMAHGYRPDMEGKQLPDLPPKYDPPYIDVSRNSDNQSYVKPYPPVEQPAAEATQQSSKRKKRMRLIIGGVAVLIIVIVIAVTVGVVLSKRNNDSHSNPSAAASTETPKPKTDTGKTVISAYSNSGAWNGTSVNVVPAEGTENDLVVLFYQDHTDELWSTTQDLDGNWSSGRSLGIAGVANATALTSITAFIGENDSTVFNHLAYVDPNGGLQDLVQLNYSGTFKAGTLSGQRDKVNFGPGVPIQMTMVLGAPGNWGFYLFASNEDGTLHEYAFNPESDEWSGHGAIAGTNAYGGVVASNANSMTSLFNVNPDNKLQYWWRNEKGGNGWQKGPVADVQLAANSSISAPVAGAEVNRIFYFDPDYKLRSVLLNDVGNAASWEKSVDSGIKAVPGSTVFAITRELQNNPDKGDKSVDVYLQKVGNDLQEYNGQDGVLELRGPLPLS